MFDKLVHLIKNNVGQAITVPALMSAISVIISLIAAMSDGKITEHELNTIFQSAAGAETISLLVILVVLKMKR